MATETYKGRTWTVQRIRPGRDHDRRNPLFVSVIGSGLSTRVASYGQARDWARELIDKLEQDNG